MAAKKAAQSGTDFHDLIVVETGTNLAGPMVSRALADFGARVLKIESRTRTDLARHRPPPPGMSRAEVNDTSHNMGAGKQNVSLNLKTECGRVIFMSLLERADIYVDSWAPGWLERLGMSHEQMMQQNERLIIVAQSAYGASGPGSWQRVFAPIMTALAGIESLVGYEDGRVVPQIGSAIGDLVAAFTSISLVLAALHERSRTGIGVVLDISQIECSAALAGIAFAEWGLGGDIPGPRGNTHPSCAPHGLYRCAGNDKWIALAVWSDQEWLELCDELDIDDVAKVRFSKRSARSASRAEVDAAVESRTRSEMRDELVRRLQARGLGCTPVLDCYEADLFEAFAERGGLWAPFQSQDGREQHISRLPWRFDTVPFGPRATAQSLGEATDDVLTTMLGATPNELERWRALGALT